MSEFNVYCDESCHLEHDGQKAMVLGAVWHDATLTRDIAREIRSVKHRHGLSQTFEAKWTKVSPAKLDFYLDLVKFFFDCPDLHFRALIVADKSRLDHAAFHQDHDAWYYKMYFDMLKVLFGPEQCYYIYIDIKDTRSAEKLQRLHEVLCHNMYDFRREILRKVQAVRSHEVEQLQLADMLIGAISYANRSMNKSPAKSKLVEYIRERSGYCLTKTTLLREEKVNLFSWHNQETQG